MAKNKSMQAIVLAENIKNEIHMWIISKDQCAFEEVDSEKISSPVLGSRY